MIEKMSIYESLSLRTLLRMCLKFLLRAFFTTSPYFLYRKSSKPLDVVAVDHLPSLLPRESSTRFSDDALPHLRKLSEVTLLFFKPQSKFMRRTSVQIDMDD